MKRILTLLLALPLLGCLFEQYRKTPVTLLPPPVVYQDTPVEPTPVTGQGAIEGTGSSVGESLDTAVPTKESLDTTLPTEESVDVEFTFPHFAVLYFKTQPAVDAIAGAACAEFEETHLKQLAALHYDIITVDTARNSQLTAQFDITTTPAVVCLAGPDAVAVLDNPTTNSISEAYNRFRSVPAPPADKAMPKPKLVYYSGPNCVPCKVMAPLVERLIVQYGHLLDVEKVDVDLAPERLEETGQYLIPQFIISSRGRRDTRAGTMSYDELVAFVSPFLPVTIKPAEETDEFANVPL